MPNFGVSRVQGVYLQNETVYGIAPNTTGTSTVANTNALKFRKFLLNAHPELLIPPDKTGSRTQPSGTAGRRTADWSAELSVIPSGAAGTPPDSDPLWRAILGATPTVVASTSVTYPVGDAVNSFTAMNFRKTTAGGYTTLQQFSAGCLASKATISLGVGVDFADVKVNGTALWVPDSINFSGLDTTGKCGLTTFPTEPSSPVTNGVAVTGFRGVATFDGNVMANLESMDISIETNNSAEIAYGLGYNTIPGGDVRMVGCTFSLYDDDSTGSTNLYTKALSKAKINFSAQVGTVTGSIMTVNLVGIQLGEPVFDDGGRRWKVNFSQSTASGSSASGGSVDEVNVVFT